MHVVDRSTTDALSDRLSRISGFPLKFTAAVTWCLLRCHQWLDEEDGFRDLIRLITSRSEIYNEVDTLVWSFQIEACQICAIFSG
jgi:hypothetical protein